MIPRLRPVIVIVVVLGVVGLGGATLMQRLGALTEDAPGSAPAASASRIPALELAGAWLNGGPLTADSLRGHPTVLVLWSDTDPRCLAALSAVEGWHQGFARFGVRVVGIYAPDYSFGADSTVPASVARRFRLTFPIALDPEYRIPLPGGSGRPVIVLADTSGGIVLTADGDRIAEVDRAIREQVHRLHPETAFPVAGDPDAAVAVARGAATHFAFLGTARASSGPLAGAHSGRTLTFTAQFRYQEEGEPFVPYPVGRWKPSAEGLTAVRGGAMNYVAIRSHGERVSLVMKPPDGGRARVWILENDAWLPESERDEDVQVDARGGTYVEVDEPRLYRLTRGGGGGRVLKLSPEDPGVTLYTFAFEPALPAPVGGVAAGTPAGGAGPSH